VPRIGRCFATFSRQLPRKLVYRNDDTGEQRQHGEYQGKVNIQFAYSLVYT